MLPLEEPSAPQQKPLMLSPVGFPGSELSAAHSPWPPWPPTPRLHAELGGEGVVGAFSETISAPPSYRVPEAVCDQTKA